MATSLLIEMVGVPGQTDAFAGKRNDAAAGVVDTLTLQAQDDAVTGQAATDDWFYWLTVTPTEGNDLAGLWKFKIGNAAGSMGMRVVNVLPGKTTYELEDGTAQNRLSGPYTLGISVVNDDTDAAVEGALVRVYRTGSTESQRSDASGDVSFAVEAATWQVAIVAPGYDSYTVASLVISDDSSVTYRLTPTATSVPDDPSLSTVTILCVDEDGAAEEGVSVYAKMTKIPSSGTGYAYDGTKQTATSDASGIATLTLVKLATYQVRRGDAEQWHEVLVADSDTQTLASFIGMP